MLRKDAKDHYRLTLVDATSAQSQNAVCRMGMGAVFSPDGKTLAAINMVPENKRDFQTRIRRWNTASGEEMPVLPNPANGKTTNLLYLAYSPDGATLAGAESKGTVILWDTASGAIREIPSQFPRHAHSRSGICSRWEDPGPWARGSKPRRE